MEVFSIKSQVELTNTSSNSNSNSNAIQSKMSIFESYRNFFSKSKIEEAGKQTSAKKTPSNETKVNSEIKEGTAIYFKGWAKFFRFKFLLNTKAPKAFYDNPEYIEQFKKIKTADEIKKKKDGEYENVPQKNNFWMMITNDQILFAKSRANAFQTVFDTLKISNIAPISEDQGYNGGLKNMGSFKEGECFKISTDSAGNWVWMICVENSKNKNNIMGLIKKLVVKNQRDSGIVLTGKDPKLEKDKKKTIDSIDSSKETLGAEQELKDVKDGYWILLQDWSSCTKFCGGGTKTLHRMCVPPKKGGQPCEGEPIITRKCNLKPCPGGPNVIELPHKNDTKVELVEPNMRVLPFSDRPQRYDKCHLKESDLLLTESLPTNGGRKSNVEHIQMPVRVVMNQFTVSAFAGMNETDVKISFDLQKTKLYNSVRDKNCFILKEISTKKGASSISEAEFCPFGAVVSLETKQEWFYDFNLFKYQCKESKGITFIKGYNDKDIEDELEKKKGELRIDVVNKRKKKMADEEKVETVTEKMKDSSLEAIQKEIKLEKMMEQEIKESQKDAIDMKAKELEKEKHKLECLNKAIKEKQIENEYNVATVNKQSRLDDLKKNIADTIKAKRQRLKAKIAKLKQLGQNQIKDYEAQIQNIRIEMVNSVSEGNYNPGLCSEILNASSDTLDKKKKNYCDEKMTTDPTEHSNCINSSKKDLLKMCCDNETDPSNPSEYQKCLGNNSDDPDKDPEYVRYFWGKPYDRVLYTKRKDPKELLNEEYEKQKKLLEKK